MTASDGGDGGFLPGLPDPDPARSTDLCIETEWLGARWRLGFGLGRDLRVRRLTIDPLDPGKAIPGDLVATARHVFALASAHLPCPSGELAQFMDWAGPSPLAAALAEILRIEEKVGAGGTAGFDGEEVGATGARESAEATP